MQMVTTTLPILKRDVIEMCAVSKGIEQRMKKVKGQRQRKGELPIPSSVICGSNAGGPWTSCTMISIL
jgi:hypothetical protein